MTFSIVIQDGKGVICIVATGFPTRQAADASLRRYDHLIPRNGSCYSVQA